MIDFKKTLINIHRKFPNLDLETIIAIIDLVVIKDSVKGPIFNQFRREVSVQN